MAAYTATSAFAPSVRWGVQGGVAQPNAVAWNSSRVNPVPRYQLGCFDTLGVRNIWVDLAPSMRNAPTPAGAATYLTATLTILGYK